MVGKQNLEKPVAIVSDKAISRGKAETMERNPEDRAFFEKLYPGWTFTDCTVEYPDDDGLKRGTSFFIRMRKEIKWTPKKKQKSKLSQRLRKRRRKAPADRRRHRLHKTRHWTAHRSYSTVCLRAAAYLTKQQRPDKSCGACTLI